MEELIKKGEITNLYNLEPEVINHITFILDDYLKKVRSVSLETLDIREKLAYLGLIAELFPVLNNSIIYLETCKQLLVSLRESIYHSEFRGLSLYDGLCNLAVFVGILYKNSGCYKKFYNSISEIISEKAILLVSNFKENKENVSFWNYDTISGLSGVGNYLLNHYTEEGGREALIKIAEYFVFLCEKVKIDKEIYPRWIGKGKNTNRIENDYVDFSIAHGIAGPLYILTKLTKRNIIVDGQMEAIKSIVNEYELISDKTGCKIWSGKIPKESYLNTYINVINRREGWCYGSISVALIFLEVSELLGNSFLYDKACNRIQEVSQKKIEELGLESPILCHGYAGTAAIFRNLYNTHHNSNYLNQGRKLLFKIIDSYSINSRFGFLQNDNALINGNLIKKSCGKLDFLEGSAGIIMEMASWTKKESRFEEMLLIK